MPKYVFINTTVWSWNKENKIYGTGRDCDGTLKVKSSDKTEPEIEVKLDQSRNQNGWSLAALECMFVEFDKHDNMTTADPSGRPPSDSDSDTDN